MPIYLPLSFLPSSSPSYILPSILLSNFPFLHALFSSLPLHCFPFFYLLFFSTLLLIFSPITCALHTCTPHTIFSPADNMISSLTGIFRHAAPLQAMAYTRDLIGCQLHCRKENKLVLHPTSLHSTPHYIISHHTYHITPHYIASHISHHITSHHTIPYHMSSPQHRQYPTHRALALPLPHLIPHTHIHIHPFQVQYSKYTK